MTLQFEYLSIWLQFSNKPTHISPQHHKDLIYFTKGFGVGLDTIFQLCFWIFAQFRQTAFGVFMSQALQSHEM